MSGGSEGLEIIGASWGRTGTSSFKEAMSILYKNDKNVGKMGACYHMRDNFANKHHAFWITIADCKNEGKPELAAQKLREMFLRLGYKASCDWPSSPYWKEQLQAFPDAKVVLAIRFDIIDCFTFILMYNLSLNSPSPITMVLGNPKNGTKV